MGKTATRSMGTAASTAAMSVARSTPWGLPMTMTSGGSTCSRYRSNDDADRSAPANVATTVATTSATSTDSAATDRQWRRSSMLTRYAVMWRPSLRPQGDRRDGAGREHRGTGGDDRRRQQGRGDRGERGDDRDLGEVRCAEASGDEAPRDA